MTSNLRPVDGSAPQIIESLGSWLNTDADPEPLPEPLIVETSGSTGRPKRVLLSRRAVLASARATEVRLGVEGRWVLALPPSYVAGLQVIVRSLLAGHAPLLVDLAEPGALGRSVALAETKPRLISLVPTQLHRLLDDPGDRSALAEMDAVLLGGGPIDPALRERAVEAGLRVTATYGSSETAGGCVYDGLPLDGVELDIDNSGRLRIGGPTLFDGYEGDRELTAEALQHGWFLTSDLAEVVDGRLRILGRVDDVVISGGVNVPGPAVEARLRTHPNVAEVAVLGVEDVEWGHRVVAFMVGRLELDEARSWVAETLPRSWAPRQVVTVDVLPLLSNGKVDRMLLRSRA